MLNMSKLIIKCISIIIIINLCISFLFCLFASMLQSYMFVMWTSCCLTTMLMFYFVGIDVKKDLLIRFKYHDTLITSAVLEWTNKIQTVCLKGALEKHFLKDF